MDRRVLYSENAVAFLPEYGTCCAVRLFASLDPIFMFRQLTTIFRTKITTSEQRMISLSIHFSSIVHSVHDALSYSWNLLWFVLVRCYQTILPPPLKALEHSVSNNPQLLENTLRFLFFNHFEKCKRKLSLGKAIYIWQWEKQVEVRPSPIFSDTD